MPDEAAFLQALVADPFDDTTRLVYADWLEECGEIERAAFLRLECSLVQMIEDTKRYTEVETRLTILRERIDPEWIIRAGKTYDVILESYDPGCKIWAIKNVRMVTGKGLKEIVDVVEFVPSTVRQRLPWDQSQEAKKLLQDRPTHLEGPREPIQVRVVVSIQQSR